jgi:hypothetical protein
MVQLQLWGGRCVVVLLLLALSACSSNPTSAPPPTTMNNPSCIMSNVFAPKQVEQREALLENLLRQYRATRGGNIVWVDATIFTKDVLAMTQQHGLVNSNDVATLQSDELIRERFHEYFLDFLLTSNHIARDVVVRNPGTVYIDWTRMVQSFTRQGCIQVPDPNYGSYLVQLATEEVTAERAAAEAVQQLLEEETRLEQLRRAVEEQQLKQRLHADPPQATSNSSLTEAFLQDYFHDIPVMVEVARCESAFQNVQSRLRQPYGREKSFGYFQIHEPDWHDAAMRLGLVNYKTDAKHNVLMARHVYNVQGLDAWKASRYCWEPAARKLGMLF